jgi:hypothetical protein
MAAHQGILIVTTSLLLSIGSGEQKGEKPATLQPKELEALWQDLASDDTMKAYQAIWALVGAPKQSIPFLEKQLKPVPPLDAKKLSQLLKDLGSDNFTTHDKATRELEKFGVLAREGLEKVLKNDPPPEVRKRVEGLLTRLDKHVLTSAELRAGRAVEALEYIANADAKKLLEQLAKGAPGAPLTEDAKETLKRLNKKTPS